MEAMMYKGIIKTKQKKAWGDNGDKFNYNVTIATLGNQLQLSCQEETFDKLEEGVEYTLPIGVRTVKATDKYDAFNTWYIRDSEVEEV